MSSNVNNSSRGGHGGGGRNGGGSGGGRSQMSGSRGRGSGQGGGGGTGGYSGHQSSGNSTNSNRRDYSDRASNEHTPSSSTEATSTPSPQGSTSPAQSASAASNNFAGRGRGRWSQGPPIPRDSHQQQSQRSSTQTPRLIKEQTDRFSLLFSYLVGHKVVATVKDGSMYEGVFYASNHTQDAGVALKMARKMVKGTLGPYIDNYVILGKDLMSLTAANVDLSDGKTDSKSKGGFMTDSAIGSRMSSIGRERELQKWVPSGGDEASLGLEDGSNQHWDQFQTNEKLFGVTTDFDEGLYTTAIDKSAPDFKKREEQAKKLAREIENDSRLNDNIHMLEERNIIAPSDAGMDEEEKYSSVVRAPGKYVPPGARNASTTAKPSVSAAARPVKTEQSPTKDTEKPAATKPPVVTKPVEPVVVVPPVVVLPVEAKMPPPLASAPLKDNISAPFKETTNTSAVKPTTPITTKVMTLPRRDGSDKQPVRKSELLSKLNVPQRLTSEQVRARDPAQVVGEASQAFKTFANQERKQNVRKTPAQILSEFKDFSASLNSKLKTPVPSDLLPILAKKPSSSGSPEPPKTAGTPQPAKSSVSKEPQPEAPKSTITPLVKPGFRGKERSSSDVAPPSTLAEADTASNTSTTPTPPATTGEKDTKTSTFKFNAAAVEFRPSFATSSPGAASPPTTGKPLGGRPSTSTGVKNGNRTSGYGKAAFNKNNGPPGPKDQNWGYAPPAHMRPPLPSPGLETADGSMYMGDPNQQYFYPVPGPYAQYVRPMMPRPYAGPPIPMGPPGVVPAYIPYPQQFPPGTPFAPMAGGPPPLRPFVSGTPGPGTAPPPSGNSSTGKNGNNNGNGNSSQAQGNGQQQSSSGSPAAGTPPSQPPQHFQAMGPGAMMHARTPPGTGPGYMPGMPMMYPGGPMMPGYPPPPEFYNGQPMMMHMWAPGPDGMPMEMGHIGPGGQPHMMSHPHMGGPPMPGVPMPMPPHMMAPNSQQTHPGQHQQHQAGHQPQQSQQPAATATGSAAAAAGAAGAPETGSADNSE